MTRYRSWPGRSPASCRLACGFGRARVRLAADAAVILSGHIRSPPPLRPENSLTLEMFSAICFANCLRPCQFVSCEKFTVGFAAKKKMYSRRRENDLAHRFWRLCLLIFQLRWMRPSAAFRSCLIVRAQKKIWIYHFYYLI